MVSSRSLRHSQYERDRGRQALPILRFGLKAFATGARELVVLCAAIVVGRAPRGTDPSAALEPVQCRVQRALWDLKRCARDLVDALGNPPTVHRLERERFENQEVERALRQVESGVVGHGSSCASTGRWKYAAALVEAQG